MGDDVWPLVRVLPSRTPCRVDGSLDRTAHGTWGCARHVEETPRVRPARRPTATRRPDPPDDLGRRLTVALPDDASLPHVGIIGDTCTVLVSGEDTAGRCCPIDMLVPPGGGLGLHRHDVGEASTVLEGEIALTFHDGPAVARAGETVNIPANAPHRFRNESDRPARLLCLCSPAGQDAFFLAVGRPVASRTATPPSLDAAAEEDFKAKAAGPAPVYRSELLGP